jgi:hypothetical protein
MAVQDLGPVWFQAVAVPSGLRTRVQPQRWITIWWWNQHSTTQSLVLVVPPSALYVTWWTSQAAAGWWQPPAHRQCRSRSTHGIGALESLQAFGPGLEPGE